MTDTPDTAARILVVDDEEAIAELLMWRLQRAGYQVLVATDGLEAWEFFQALPFDLVIADLKMPRLDGEQLVQYIKGRAPHTPIVVLTGHGTPQSVERLLSLGVAQVLYKPLEDLSDLTDLIAQILGGEPSGARTIGHE